VDLKSLEAAKKKVQGVKEIAGFIEGEKLRVMCGRWSWVFRL